MVDYGAKRPLDPVLANALRRLRRLLSFEPLIPDPKKFPNRFVSDHRSNNSVAVTRVAGYHGLQALIYKTPIHEDDDGDPEAYGKPPDAKHVTPQSGVRMKETSLKNGTNQSDADGAVFHDDPTLNTFTWTGVRSRHDPPQKDEPAGEIDKREFLKDTFGRYPIFRPGSNDFYAAQTAMVGADGQAVNAQTVPYGALCTALREHGRVMLGDVGLAIRMSTGVSGGFLFADAGGKTSSSVGEYSVKLARTLFGAASPTSEAISFIVFPRSTDGDVARPELIPRILRNKLEDLTEFDNVDDIITRLANPQLGEPLFIGRSFIPRTGSRIPNWRAVAEQDTPFTKPQPGERLTLGQSFLPAAGWRSPISHALAEENDIMEATVRLALRRAGLPR